ncbi:MAG: ABC transporter substrate-binding protein [Candidatus Saccharimonadales bacterium]
MRLRLIRLRFRRELRKSQKQVEGLGTQTERAIEEHLFKRFARLGVVRRFVGGWLLLLLILITGLVAQNILLSGYFQTLRPVPGGIYKEGVIGTFTTANPLYATSNADSTVARLVFASLFTYDDSDRLVGDLASDYSVDARGTTYTVHLKPRLTWQDGRPLTSADVLFTYQTIQNPDAQSPLQSSWQGVDVSAPDARTVVFKLSNPLASFAYNLTNGIVPKHLLADIPASDLRAADFNTVHPVGAGPFAWQTIQVTGKDPSDAEEQIALVPFERYQAGAPKLQEFIVHAYAKQSQLAEAFTAKQVTAAEGLDEVPPHSRDTSSVQVHSPLLHAANMVFFKTSSGVLADGQVRRALVQAANVPKIIHHLSYPTRQVRTPLLIGQLGYDPSLAQPGFDLRAARQALDTAGWTVDKDGYRAKGGQPLTFTLSAADTPEYRSVTRQLQEQWRALGVRLNLRLLATADFQTTLISHGYDAVLYGISIGQDPDVFVYWDSSQADVRSANRLNLSEYKNTTADAALEAGRTRLNPALRVIKYRPFLEAWQQDAPALGLYQPRLLYLTNGAVAGLSDNALNTPTDRFIDVQNWQIRQAKVTNQ